MFCCDCEGFGKAAGLGATGGFGGMDGFCEREGAVCCFFSLFEPLASVLPGAGGVGMLPVELVFGRVRDLQTMIIR